METRLGARFAELKTKYDELEGQQKAEHRQPTFAEALTALRDLTGIIVEGKRAQVDALNQNNFSLEEYAWVRQQVYSAAGLALTEMDFRKLASAAQEGSREVPLTTVTGNEGVPDRNKELVKPYVSDLQKWMALGFFGL